mmetsp:Transcript_27221/g.41112  ORF Transcript_27221/g.41112 Transcript_27221/m.41112 type:complete len:340 (-) Transcript_27221:96-1115(-)|eukprot:scaffold34616_cov159-Skeletonema_dohrnii-CCMP3373.AAC.9
MITTKTKSTGDLMPSSSMSTITSSVHSIKSNAATRRHQHIRNGGSNGGSSLRSRPPRPPLKPIHKTSNNNNLKREYKIRESQTLLLLITTTISFLLFLLFTLPFYALVGLTMMTTFLGLGIVVATSALKTRYLLELEHPLGLLRYLPQKVRVPLTEKSLHDCLISPSTSLNSLKSLDRGSSGGGGSGNNSNNSSKNSLSSMLNNKGNNGSNHSSMESLASYNYNSNKKNSSSLSSLSYPRRSSSRPSLLPPPPPTPDRDEDDDDIKPNHTSEFTCSGFDVMRQATVKMGNKTVANQSISQQKQHQNEKENGDNDKRKREEGGIKSDRYSIYQTNQQVIR